MHKQVSVPTQTVTSDAETEDTSVPKLAYTPANALLHAYHKDVSRILTRVDGVQSGGHKEVWMKHRELARHVEKRPERVERIRALAWRVWQKKQAEEQQMVVE